MSPLDSAGEPGRASRVGTLGGSYPVISGDGLTLFFASNRSPSIANDVWVTTRPSTSSTFGAPTRVSEVSTGNDDHLMALSRDGCRLYIAKNGSAATLFGWYVAERPAP